MLHVLTKKSKGKSSQRSHRSEALEHPITKWEPLDVEVKSATPDVRQQRKFHQRKSSSRPLTDDIRMGGSMRTRSTSSRRSCSAMVTFESIQPTQVWQASASPSPPANPVTTTARHMKPNRATGSLTLSMITRAAAENQWLSLSTGDEDDLSDSSEEDAEEASKRTSTSTANPPRSSLSSSDTSSSFEMSRSPTKSSCHRRRQKSSRRHRRDSAAFSSESTSSESSSSSSSSEGENEFDLCWKMKAGGSLRSATPIQSTPQLKRTPHQHHQSMVVPPTGTPQVMTKFPSNHQFARPQTLSMSGTAFPRIIPGRSSSKDPPFVQSLARAVEDFFPTLEWIEKYKVISVHRGDLLRIIPYPGTSPEKTSPTTGWFLVQKWCTDHRLGTGPIGFVPRIICSLSCPESTPRLPHVSPRHTHSQDFSTKTSEVPVFMTSSDELRPGSGAQISITSAVCDTASEPIHTHSAFPSPQFDLHAPPATAVKTSFTSIPAVYEIEDRDSGRGPSSGSEWSSGKGGSLSGATDINLDDKEHPQPPLPVPTTRASPHKWSTSNQQRRSSLDHPSATNFACPVPPPPMALLSHICADALVGKKTASPKSDPEGNGGSTHSAIATKSRLYVRGLSVSIGEKQEQQQTGSRGSPATSEEGVEDEGENGSPPTVVVPSNSDPTRWEPYKTMIQVGQNKLEKFTLV
ncbi:unnamed protein product [Mesocestoides corti]|uniref:SAM domain-containing protein n=1 Tax=Mesocestoides corti TaxID=53468 RepID=A0A0R3U870_MESCO|nr:unnamed protein product [Mesocestoides corti]